MRRGPSLTGDTAEFTAGPIDAPIATAVATVLAAPTGVASATLGQAAAVFPATVRAAIMARTGGTREPEEGTSARSTSSVASRAGLHRDRSTPRSQTRS